MKKITVCTACGSANVLIDAFVHANDPSNVQTFDDKYCQSCDGPCKTQTVEVLDSFDIEADFWKEGMYSAEQLRLDVPQKSCDDDVLAGERFAVGDRVFIAVATGGGECAGCVGSEDAKMCSALPDCFGIIFAEVE